MFSLRRALAVGLILVGATLVSTPGWAATDSATYTYDALGRVTEIAYANGTTIAYNYDPAGNRTSVVAVCGRSGC